MAVLLKIAVLASGRGSTLAALADACAKRQLKAQIVGVFSDKPQAGALTVASAYDIPSHVLPIRQFRNRDAFDQTLFKTIDAAKPDLIICAGFMRVLSASVVMARTQRLLNIHPALLPKYTGLNTHQRAIDAGDSEHGASVHFVTPTLDAGPVIAQTRIPIQVGENAEALAARLLPYEHQLFIDVVDLFARHKLRHDGQQVFIDGIPQEHPRFF